MTAKVKIEEMNMHKYISEYDKNITYMGPIILCFSD